MERTSPRMPWYLAARDALHVAELALNAGKYPVAALLCHRAACHALRGAFGPRGRAAGGRRADVERLADGLIDRCSEPQRQLVARLGAVAAAWSDAPQSPAGATKAACEQWLRETLLLVEGLVG